MATMTLDDLVTQLRAAYGSRLRAVVLYGSAAASEQVPGVSDYNVLVLLGAIEPSALTAASAVARAWNEAGNPAPLTMTLDEWRGSADVFPMEYADILERHRVLTGDPPFEGIQVAAADLRRQLEYQAMGKLLQLRQGTIAAGGDGARQLELLEASLSTFMVLFRAAVRLTGASAPTDYVELCDAVGRMAGLDPAPFVRVVRHARGEQPIARGEARAVLEAYLAGVGRFASYVDQLALT